MQLKIKNVAKLKEATINILCKINCVVTKGI